MKKQKSPAPERAELDETFLFYLLLLLDIEKKKIELILTKDDQDVNSDERDLIPGPVFDIMRGMEGREL